MPDGRQPMLEEGGYVRFCAPHTDPWQLTECDGAIGVVVSNDAPATRFTFVRWVTRPFPYAHLVPDGECRSWVDRDWLVQVASPTEEDLLVYALSRG